MSAGIDKNQGMSSLEELIAHVAETGRIMDRLAAAMPVMREALAHFEDTTIDMGSPEINAGVPESAKQTEAALIEATSGEFNRARLRLLESLRWD